MLHVDAGHALHHLAGKMQRGSDAGRGVVVLAGILLEQREEIFGVRCRKVFCGHQDVRQLPQAADERKIIGRFVRQFRIGADGDHVVRDPAHADGVTVRGRLGDGIVGDHAAGADTILDHELLPGQRAHLLTEHARKAVGGASGGEAEYIAHRARRPGLLRKCEVGKQRRCAKQSQRTTTVDPVPQHGRSPCKYVGDFSRSRVK